jgi:hypothetical protein
VTVHQSNLVRWQQRESEIDDLRRRDLKARFVHQQNNFNVDRDAFVSEASRILRGQSLLARHCSRLRKPEIVDVLTNGLSALSPALVEQRLSAAFNAGDLSDDEYSELLQNHVADDVNRQFCCLILGRAPLRDESSVVRLMRSWGGEAVYLFHEHTPLGQRLRMIGRPCIVEAVVPVNLLDNRMFVDRFATSIGMNQPFEDAPHMRDSIPGSQIMGIIDDENPEFEQLTGASTWLTDLY